jgi:hypothetical protein
VQKIKRFAVRTKRDERREFGVNNDDGIPFIGGFPLVGYILTGVAPLSVVRSNKM